MIKLIKKAYYVLDSFCNKIFWLVLKVFLAIFLDVFILLSSLFVYWYFFTLDGTVYRTKQVYKEISVITGQSQDKLPLYIVYSKEDNAYNDGNKVVLYTGLLQHVASMDEVAFIIGHEVAHGNLGHLNNDLGSKTDEEIQVLEANADKLGAFYMMKAGYNVCKGNKIFLYWKKEKGDYLGGNHPNYAYRYDQLNIGCD